MIKKELDKNSNIIASANLKRQPCEVWTRVMGYHRPVESFNTGKKAEHAQRRFFAETAQIVK